MTYEKYGEECPKHLLGDFAFVIFDEKKEKVFCARDHMGGRTLYYNFQKSRYLDLYREHIDHVDHGIYSADYCISGAGGMVLGSQPQIKRTEIL